MAGRFRVVAQGSANAGGYGTLTLTCPAGVSWLTDAITLTAYQTVDTYVPEGNIYASAQPSPSALLEGTDYAVRTTTDTPHHFGPGEALTAEWIGAQPGAVLTLMAAGTQTQQVG